MAEDRIVALARLVSMVNFIDRNPGVLVEEIALHFGRSKSQVKRDISLLDQAGFDDLLPGRTFEIDMDMYFTKGRLALRSPLLMTSPISLTQQEQARLLLGLEAIAATLNDEEREILPRTISSLLAMAGSKEKAVPTLIDADWNTHQEVFHRLQEALTKGVSVTFDYTDAGGDLSKRHVAPHNLVRERDGWILNGFCMTAKAERSFRLDRISTLVFGPQIEVASLPDSVTNQKENDLSAPIEKSGAAVTVHFEKSAQWLLGESVAKTVVKTRDGYKATYQVHDEDWFLSELLLLAPYILRTDPSEYLVRAGDLARRAVAARQALSGEAASND